MRLLVASHDASRTGAPLALLTFLSWIARERPEVDVEIVLWRGGALVPAYEAVAAVTVLHPPPGRRSLPETVEVGLDEVGAHGVSRAITTARVRARLRSVEEPDLVFLNGAGSGILLPHLRTTAPVLAHLHELARGLDLCLPGDLRRRFFDRADRFVAVSQRVADNLVENEGLAPERVTVIHVCLPERGVVPLPAPVPPGPPLVASIGAGSWRKGVDLFLLVAAGVRRRVGDQVRFAWVGPLDDEASVLADRRGLGLDGILLLPGEVEDPANWYAAMAVFCLTAREDPFPLVAIEAGAAGVPVVTFDSGGVTELLADGRGSVVAYGDVEAMADRVAAILTAGDGGAAERLAERVAEHHTPEVMSRRLWAEAEALVDGQA